MRDTKKFTFKKKPNITKKVLLDKGFQRVGKMKGLSVFKRRINIPLSINPFIKLISKHSAVGLVLTANADVDISQHIGSKDLVYRVGVNVETSIADDCIILDKKTLNLILSVTNMCYSDHVDYGEFMVDQSKMYPKKKISIIKKIKSIIKKI
tara:strand:+ start:1596 stop:2051 length:456 start_codon:yes stop_codon:yes gene_type:complete